MDKDQIIEEQNKSLAEAWNTIEMQEEQIERLKSLLGEFRCGIKSTSDMRRDDTFVVNEWTVHNESPKTGAFFP